MKVDILCVDDSGLRAMEHRKSLEKEWSIEELHDVKFPFFLQWFDDWKRRASRSTNDESLRGC
jgi:hypothetical protein